MRGEAFGSPFGPSSANDIRGLAYPPIPRLPATDGPPDAVDALEIDAARANCSAANDNANPPCGVEGTVFAEADEGEGE